MRNEEIMDIKHIRTRWAAIGAAVAITLGAGGIGITHATTSSGERAIYKPINPCRLADLRPAPDTVGPRSAGLGPNETYTLDGWGAVGDCVLPSNTAGLALNVTAVSASAPTFLALWPADGAQPTTSNLNPAPGQPPTPNAVNVDLAAATGAFNVFNKAGNVSVIIDVVGIYDDHNHDDRYYTESESDAKLATKANSALFAFVDFNDPGTIVRSSPGVSLSHTGSGGGYFLTFPRDITACAWTASLGGAGVLDNLLPALNNLGIAASQGNNLFVVDPDEILVSVYNPAGALVLSAFSLVVTCP